MVHSAHSVARSYDGFSLLPRFEVHAEPGPQTLARIVGLFAAQNLTPADLTARQSCGGIWIALHLDVTPRHATLLAEKLRSLVCVEAVILVPAPEPDWPLEGDVHAYESDAGAAGED
jgi:hypothetical protein